MSAGHNLERVAKLLSEESKGHFPVDHSRPDWKQQERARIDWFQTEFERAGAIEGRDFERLQRAAEA